MPSSRGSSWIPGGLNSALLHCSEILYHLSHQGSPFNWYVFFFFDNFIYDCSGLHCLWAFSSCREWGLLFSCSSRASHCGSFSCCRNGLQGMRVSAVAVPKLQSTKLWLKDVVALQPGIFPDQGLNLCLLYCQADYLPLSH